MAKLLPKGYIEERSPWVLEDGNHTYQLIYRIIASLHRSFDAIIWHGGSRLICTCVRCAYVCGMHKNQILIVV